ncbi:hypothetical protein SeF3a_229 [Salmonella phage SeF3a]|nr:hypothetical protein SeF3a_229 [Salmonella phage SeF3a]
MVLKIFSQRESKRSRALIYSNILARGLTPSLVTPP